ncbi:MAG: single-stranded DNA-binding protein [Dehalococcoidales bacterium]
MNLVVLQGNLGRDPEVLETAKGTVCKFSIATNRKWKNNQGETQEEVCWHRIVTFGRTADSCGQYLKKGRGVTIEGRIKNDSYENKDGVKVYTSEVIARDVRFGSVAQAANSDYSPSNPPDTLPAASFGADDIPF